MKNVVINVSARHVHLTQADLDTLYGKGYTLTKMKDLVQPGEFAAYEKVTVSTPNGRISNVRILGPVRAYSQIELSKTDARILKIDPPVRDSGDLMGTPGATIEGPCGSVDLQNGCIIAARHIHMTESEARQLGVKNKQKVKVEVIDYNKGGVLYNVSCKVGDNYAWEMHVDTDDANAMGIKSGSTGVIILK